MYPRIEPGDHSCFRGPYLSWPFLGLLSAADKVGQTGTQPNGSHPTPTTNDHRLKIKSPHPPPEQNGRMMDRNRVGYQGAARILDSIVAPS